jgi:hypothetical protein
MGGFKKAATRTKIMKKKKEGRAEGEQQFLWILIK